MHLYYQKIKQKKHAQAAFKMHCYYFSPIILPVPYGRIPNICANLFGTLGQSYTNFLKLGDNLLAIIMKDDNQIETHDF